MKNTIFIYLILTTMFACNQVDKDQRMVLRKVISDQSIHTFFDGKERIKLIKNGYCNLNQEDTVNVGNKVVQVVNIDSAKESDALKFIKYESVSDTIYIAITLFSKNVIYSATYRKVSRGLNVIKSNTTFIKADRN